MTFVGACVFDGCVDDALDGPVAVDGAIAVMQRWVEAAGIRRDDLVAIVRADDTIEACRYGVQSVVPYEIALELLAVGHDWAVTGEDQLIVVRAA